MQMQESTSAFSVLPHRHCRTPPMHPAHSAAGLAAQPHGLQLGTCREALQVVRQVSGWCGFRCEPVCSVTMAQGRLRGPGYVDPSSAFLQGLKEECRNSMHRRSCTHAACQEASFARSRSSWRTDQMTVKLSRMCVPVHDCRAVILVRHTQQGQQARPAVSRESHGRGHHAREQSLHVSCWLWQANHQILGLWCKWQRSFGGRRS